MAGAARPGVQLALTPPGTDVVGWDPVTVSNRHPEGMPSGWAVQPRQLGIALGEPLGPTRGVGERVSNREPLERRPRCRCAWCIA